MEITTIKKFLALLLLIGISGCTETNSNNDTANELKTWEVALECTNEKYAREKTFGWYQENYIFLNSKREKVREFRAKFSTEKQGLLWASESRHFDRGLIVSLDEYRWFGIGEWYWEMKKPKTDLMVLNRETLVLTWKPYGYMGQVFEQICELSTIEKLNEKIEKVEADNIVKLQKEQKQKEREKADQLERNKI